MNRWAGSKVLVTGAGGFIGSHLAERLVALGAQVRVLLRYNSRNDLGMLAMLPDELRARIEVVRGDIRDADTVLRITEGIDTVFHLAALISIPYSYVNPGEFVQTNVCGTSNMLEAVRRNRVGRLVVTSTSEVYGSALRVPMDEAHPLQAQSPYSATKIAADALATSHWLSFRLPVVIARPFNAYGPRQSPRAVIPNIVFQAMRSDTINLGRTDTTRDFNFVGDTVEGFLAVADCDAAIGSVLNIGTGHEVSIGEVVDRIGRILGKPLAVATSQERYRPDASEVLRLCADSARVRSIAGWAPSVDLDTGLARTIEWLRAQNVDPAAGAYVV